SCQILYLPQNANSPAAVTYLRHEYARLQRSIEAIAGRSVTEDDLRRSMAVYNRNRFLLRELYALKRTTPWLVSADEAYILVAIGGMIPREEHNELLETVLPQLAARPNKKQDKIRLVFEGGFCEQPPLDLIRAIARSCYVVDGDPLLNLATAYLENSSYSPVQHDLRKPKEKMLIERIRNSQAEAAILTA